MLAQWMVRKTLVLVCRTDTDYVDELCKLMLETHLASSTGKVLKDAVTHVFQHLPGDLDFAAILAERWDPRARGAASSAAATASILTDEGHTGDGGDVDAAEVHAGVEACEAMMRQRRGLNSGGAQDDAKMGAGADVGAAGADVGTFAPVPVAAAAATVATITDRAVSIDADAVAAAVHTDGKAAVDVSGTEDAAAISAVAHVGACSVPSNTVGGDADMAIADREDADVRSRPAEDPVSDVEMLHTVASPSGDGLATDAAPTQSATADAAGADTVPPTKVAHADEFELSDAAPDLQQPLEIVNMVRQYARQQAVVAGPLPEYMTRLHDAVAQLSGQMLQSRCWALRCMLDRLCVRMKSHPETHAPMPKDESADCEELEWQRKTRGMLPVRSWSAKLCMHMILPRLRPELSMKI